MRAIGYFDPINPGESEIFSFDFVNDLRAGDSIPAVGTPVVWTLIVAPNGGVDPTPQSHITGPAANVGTKSSQRIAGTLGPVLYIVIATATTSLGDTLKLWAYLPSVTPGTLAPTPV